jgi:hypothetical protein
MSDESGDDNAPEHPLWTAVNAAWDEREKAARHFATIRRNWQNWVTREDHPWSRDKRYADNEEYDEAIERLVMAHKAYKLRQTAYRVNRYRVNRGDPALPFRKPYLVSSVTIGAQEEDQGETLNPNCRYQRRWPRGRGNHRVAK